MVLGMALLAFLSEPTAGCAPTTPNFVVIMADDLGYGDLSCYGSEHIRTPHLDALARSGMRLTDFHSSGAVCSPTRAGLLTGRYQQRAGIPGVLFADPRRRQHRHGLQSVEHTFAESLAGAGYRTAVFGKWHLGYRARHNPVRHGFDEFRGYVSGNVDYFSHVDQAGAHDWWINEKRQDEVGYSTHLITQHAVRFIRQSDTKPFCLYVAHEAPHYPYQGPGDRAIRRVGVERGNENKGVDIPRAYREMVQAVDSGVGEVVQALEEKGLRETTLVLFFSDNGATRHGSNGVLRGWKGSLWEGGHRVPCIAAWPGTIAAASRSDQTAITIDVLPTLLDYAGVDLSKSRPPDGVSLRGVFAGKTPPSRTLFWQHGPSTAARRDQWKLLNQGKSAPRLFDLSDDLGESRSVAADHPEVVRELSSALAEWQREVRSTATPQPE